MDDKRIKELIDMYDIGFESGKHFGYQMRIDEESTVKFNWFLDGFTIGLIFSAMLLKFLELLLQQ
jgi:hypothetical protein